MTWLGEWNRVWLIIYGEIRWSAPYVDKSKRTKERRIKYLKESAHMVNYDNPCSRPNTEINTIWKT